MSTKSNHNHNHNHNQSRHNYNVNIDKVASINRTKEDFTREYSSITSELEQQKPMFDKASFTPSNFNKMFELHKLQNDNEEIISEPQASLISDCSYTNILHDDDDIIDDISNISSSCGYTDISIYDKMKTKNIYTQADINKTKKMSQDDIAKSITNRNSEKLCYNTEPLKKDVFNDGPIITSKQSYSDTDMHNHNHNHNHNYNLAHNINSNDFNKMFDAQKLQKKMLQSTSSMHQSPQPQQLTQQYHPQQQQQLTQPQQQPHYHQQHSPQPQPQPQYNPQPQYQQQYNPQPQYQQSFHQQTPHQNSDNSALQAQFALFQQYVIMNEKNRSEEIKILNNNIAQQNKIIKKFTSMPIQTSNKLKKKHIN